MKKFLLLLFITPLLSFGQLFCRATVNVDTDEYLNMRTEPSVSSKIVTDLSSGEVLSVTGNFSRKWIEVWKGDTYASEEPIQKGWVNVDFVTAPNFSSNILGDANDFNQVIEEKQGWMVQTVVCAQKTLIIGDFCILNGELIELEYDGKTSTYFNDKQYLSIKKILLDTGEIYAAPGWLIVNYKGKKEFIFIKNYWSGC